ncbi:MAG: PKD-like domain-containing protein, partial [Bacteroidia bacterium]
MKTLYTATLALILLLVPFAKAQWTQTNGPYANSSVLCFATDGTNLFAGTQNSGIYLSTDFGANWILKSDGLNFQSVRTMLINGSNIYTATAGGLYLSSDNGANWTFKLSGGFYSSSSLVVNGTTFIAASNGGIYRSTNGGANWTSVSGALLNATLAVVGNNFIAATSSGVYKSTDDGITWNLVNNTLTNVQAFKASGTNLYAGTTGSGVYLSTDYGSTWTAKNTGLTNLNITSFEFNGTDLYAGCSAGVFNTSNSGASWTAVNSGIASTTVNALAIMGAQIFAGTNNTGVYQTGNFGASWSASNNGLVTSDVRALGFNGANLFAGSNGTGAFLTSSSGANWNGVNTGLTNQTINAIAANGINTFAGTNNGMFLTTNNGATWTPINSGLTNTSINDIAVSGSSIFAATNGGVFLSTNNGTSWTAVNTGLTGTQVQCLTINGSNIFAGIPYQGIFLSTNNGTSWTAVNTGLPNLSGVYTIYSLVRIGTNIFTAIGSNSGGGVYKTINNGSTWTYANNNNAYELGVSGTNLFAFAYGASISTDSGSTWSSINTGLPTLPHYGFASNGSTIFVGSTGLGVWKRQLNEILCSVNPPVMSSVSANTICSGQSVNIALTNTGVAATYSWIATDNPQTTGESTTSQTSSTLNNTITNSSTTSATTVTYTITPTGISGGCAGTPQTVNVLVNPSAVMTSNSSLTICSGQSVGLSFTSSAASSYSWIASNNTNVTGESTTPQSSGTLNDILTNTSTTPQIVTYTVTPTATAGNCAGTAQTVSITVNPKPSMTSAAAGTICSNGTVNIPLTSNVASNYTWIASDNTNTVGESTFLQSPGTLSNTIVNNTSVAQTITYTVTPTAIVGGCTNTQIVTVTVNPAPVMTSSNSTSLCSGNTLGLTLTSNIASSYSWIASDNPNTSGESVTQQSSSTLNNTLTNNSSIAQTIYYSVTPTSSSAGCTGTSQSVAVTVNPLPTMTSSNISSICSGNVVSIPLSANIASGFSWIATDNTNTTGESTSAQSSSTLTNTITNSTALQQTVTYTIIPTSTTLGNCVGTPQTVTVTVNPKPSMTSTSTGTICSGGTVNILLTSNVASTYTWVATNNTNTVGESVTLQSANALSNVITNNSTTDQNVVYTITPTSTSGGCVGSSQTVTVNVKPIPSMTNTSSATICSGSSVSIALSSNISSSYTWIAADNPNITGESITSQLTSTLSNTLVNNSTLAQNVLYTVTPTSTTGSCTGVPQTVTVVVNPVPTVTSSSTAIICSGGTVNIPFTSSAPSDYSWVATDNSNTTGESTTSQVTSTLNNTIINNSAIVQNVVYTVTPTAKLGGCVGAAQTITVVVNPTPTITSALTATICSGSNVTISLTSDIASGFYWTAADNVNTSGESTTSQSNATLSNTITNNSAIAQNVVYTVTPTSTNGNCVGTPQTVTVTVNPAPVITNSTTATICSAGAVTIPLTSNVASTFSWVASDNPNTTGESTTAQSTSTLNNTITNNSSLAQNVIYTVTPTSTTGSCVGASQTVTVVVNPVPTMTSLNAATICSGGSVAIALSASTPSSFSWIAANNANTTGESITTESSATLNNTITSTSATAQNVVYTVTPTATLGGCTGASQTVTLVVNPKPIMTSASSATICSGGSVNIPLTSNIASNYSWIAADNLNTTGESTTAQSNGTLNNTIINNSATAKNVIYSVTPTSTAGSCVGTTQTVTVTVNPSPTLTNSTSSTICSAGAVTIPLTSNVASTFSWVASDNPNTIGESTTAQSTSTLNNIITNNSSLAQNVIYTVTPTSTTGSCVGASQTLTVVVNPVPVMTSTNSVTLCSGENVAISLSATASSSFSWIATDNVNTTGESTVAQSTNTLSNTITNNSTTAQSVVYTITPTATVGGCVGSSQTVTVLVNPLPIMTSAVTATICSGASVNIPLSSNIASSYSWFAADNVNTTGESTTSQFSGTLNNTIINNSTSSQNIVYAVTPISSAGNCSGSAQTVNVTVNPAPAITNLTSTTICSGDTVSIALLSNISSIFTWIANDNANTIGESINLQSADTLQDVITNNSSIIQTVSYTVTPSSLDGCSGNAQIINVQVNPNPIMTNVNTASVCSGNAVNISLSSNVSATFTWVALDNINTTGESLTLQSGSVLNNAITNDSSFAQNVIYTVTPTATFGGCTGLPQNITVTVNPAPKMTSTVADTICSGTSVNILLVSDVSSHYSWSAINNSNTTGESISSQSASSISNTITNNSSVAQNVVYSVTPTSTVGGCVGA